jgi:hypothetical protein
LRSKFSPAEDEQLRTLVDSIGPTDWCEIADRMPGRNARQCKERWTNYLSPTLNTAAWTRDEDFLLIQKYAEFGSRWTQIASFFPNRTDSMLKNRFNRLQRREQKRRELLLRGELTFVAPFLLSAVQSWSITSSPPSTATAAAAVAPSPVQLSEKEESVAIESEADQEQEFATDCWGDSFCFTDEMYSF